MEKATAISPVELLARVAQLNIDIEPLAEQISDLLEKYNRETGGHAVDLIVNLQWSDIMSEPNKGDWQWRLARSLRLSAEEKPLPGPRLHSR